MYLAGGVAGSHLMSVNSSDAALFYPSLAYRGVRFLPETANTPPQASAVLRRNEPTQQMPAIRHLL